MSTKLSIIIVTYNSSGNIVELLKSIKLSHKLIEEIIIIENNSPEMELTTRYIDQFSKKNEILKIKYIQSENNDGFARSCNRGAKVATGEYILFLNPDTKLRQSSLPTLLKHAITSKADITGGLAINRHHNPHNAAVRRPTLLTGLLELSNLGKLFNNDSEHKYFYYKDIEILKSKNDQLVDAVSGAYLLIRKTSFNKLKGFDERFFMYLEDVDLGVRANKLNMRVMFCPHSKIFHEGGASSQNKYNIHHQAWYDSRKKYYTKHFGFIVNMIIQPLFSVEEIMLKMLRPNL